MRGATSDEKEEVDTRKKNIQKALWDSIGIKVDKVVQGSGTSNTGNVSRRFFEHADEAAVATGVDKRLISRFGTILQVISSGNPIKEDKFNIFAYDTAKLFVELYGWYRMPPSVHKILLHGSLAIKHALVPIGQLSEEAQEARNKDMKRFRAHHTRKSSYIKTYEDLVHMLLISSDPVITGLRTFQTVPLKELSPDAKELLTDSVEEVEQHSDAEKDSPSESEDSDFEFI